jgi:hypothetical protein
MAVAMFTAATAQAQIKFGVKGGLNLTSMSTSGNLTNNFDKSNRAGFFVGPLVRVQLPITGLAVEAAALYDQRSSDITYYEINNVGGYSYLIPNETTITQKSIVIPINARFTFGLGSLLGVFINAGPQFGFNLGKDTYDLDAWKSDFNAQWNSVSDQFQLKKSNFSVNVGAGVKVKKLEVGVNYNIAMGKTAEIKGMSAYDFGHGLIDNAKVKTNAWQVYAAIVF